MSTNGPIPPPQPVPVDSEHPCKIYQYAVKLLCGVANEQMVVAPGRYFTAVNIHNPATCKTVTFRWKVAQANRVSGPMGRITPFRAVTIRPDQAVEIDCPDILEVTDLKTVKGFVVIESPCELDVVGVYTVEPLQPGQASAGVAFDIERVPARMICACNEDLNLNLSTGVADWQLISAPPGLPGVIPRTADIILPAYKNSLWLPAITGTQWIGAFPFANQPAIAPPPGDYTFQTCFSLCSGFQNPNLTLSMRHDNAAPSVWMNGTLVGGPFPQNYNLPPNTVTITSGFLPGVNCLSIIVNNGPPPPTGDNPMGLDVSATMIATTGSCGDCCGCGCSDNKLVRPPQVQPVPTD